MVQPREQPGLIVQNTVKRKLTQGKTVFGTWNAITSATVCEVIAQTDIDFQILDMEHGSFSFENIENCIRAIENYDCSPLVRVGGLNLNDSQKALDLGAHGLIFPQVKGVEETKLAMQFTQFAPKGIRGLNPFTRYQAFSVNEKSNLFQKESDFSLRSIILENKESLDQIDQILDVPDLDLVYLGAYDMSVVLGRPGKMNSPEVQNFIETGIKKVRAAKKAVGVMTSDVETAKRYEQLGANFIVLGVDTNIIGNSVQKIINSFK